MRSQVLTRFSVQEMDVKAFWAVQIAAIHAADAYSPIN
jgi:hypothetical protein